ncbi:MAG TPA: TetR/AcrR family transcriptional regulator [bacterium]|jgi:AcrR family transcriptional regulator
MARKWKRGEERIRELLDAAEKEFLEKGYEGAVIVDIAKRSGVSPALMYRYFPDKADILSSVCDRMFEPLDVFMSSADEQDDAVAALHRFLIDYLSFWERNPRLVEFYFLDRLHTMEDDQRRARYIGAKSGFFVWLHQTLAWGVEENVLGEHNKAALAEALMYAMEGAMIHVAILRDTKVKRAVARIERALLWDVRKG